MSPRASDLFLRSQSDERLVTLARAGHDRAFAAIVQRYRQELLALARRLGADGRAEDLLQQAFLSAFVALRSGTEVQHLRGWLHQIVRNAASKGGPPAELALDHVDVAGEPLEETVLRRARALAAMSELARLPERQRGALVATALGDRAHADVAVSMGISEQAVRQLVHRARATLRGAVTGITPWPLARWLANATNVVSAPDVAVSAGAVTTTGVTMKLGALFVATGALATGVAVGPLHHVHSGGSGRSAVRHGDAGAGAPARIPRAAVPQAAPAVQVARRDPERRSSRPTGSAQGSAAPQRGRGSPGRGDQSDPNPTGGAGSGDRGGDSRLSESDSRSTSGHSGSSEGHPGSSEVRSSSSEGHSGSSEGHSGSSDGGGGDHSGSGSNSNSSDTSTEGD